MNCLSRIILTGLTGAALIGGFLSTESAAGPAPEPVGTLKCRIEGPDVALHFASNRTVSCVYRPDGGGRRQYYTGEFRKYGVEVGIIGRTAVDFRVLSPRKRLAPGALAGTYRGATIEATIGAGSGANVLLRDGPGDIALDLGMQLQVGGLNAAVGVTRLELRPARR